MAENAKEGDNQVQHTVHRIFGKHDHQRWQDREEWQEIKEVQGHYVIIYYDWVAYAFWIPVQRASGVR